MLYIFLIVITMLIVGAMSTDNIVIGQVLENTYRNAPFVVQNFYAMMAILTCLMTTAFVNDAASRDFAHKTSQLMFTKPISKFGFLMGRFWGAVCIAIIPILGVSLGALLGPEMPWNDNPDRFRDVVWGAHLWGILVFVIPNTIFLAAIIFAISVWLRSTFASFIGIILILVAYGITQNLVGNLDNEWLAKLLDPFAISTFNLETKYWTLDERNNNFITLANSTLLMNRALWVSVGLGILTMACWRFSFAERNKAAKKVVTTAAPSQAIAVALPSVTFHQGFGAQLKQLWSQIRVDFFSTVKSPVFLVIVFAGMLDTFFSLRTAATEGFGLSALPVTYTLIDIIQASLIVYLMAIIVVYTGSLIWKERDAKLDEVMDALPHSSWISYTAKLLSMMGIILIVMSAETVMAVTNQAMAGYSRFQLPLYFQELFCVSFFQYSAFTVLAMICHIVSPNKYVGYFLFIIVAILNTFAWGGLEIQTNLLQFAQLPSYVYSDMFEFKPFAGGLAWFGSYWTLFCIVLSCVGLLFWQRGRERGFWNRIGIAASRFKGNLALCSLGALVAWGAIGAWTFYNTKVLNSYKSPEAQNQLQVDYEQEFKAFADHVHPRTTDVRYEIDIFPHKRGLVVKGTETLKNKSDQEISRILVTTADGYETKLKIENGNPSEVSTQMKAPDPMAARTEWYDLNPALKPGESIKMEYEVSYFSKGFENSISHMDLVQNGTFFNNQIAPKLGYQPGLELQNKNDRERFELEEIDLMPPLEPENLNARGNTYLSNSSDWVNVETIISTSDDQIAIAPGSLIKKWEKDGRRYFHYKVDHPSMNFYSFISADYQVELREWKGIDIEVYYHHEHQWNVDKMLRSVRKSLEYYTENFGPYRHKQARIIEFPRTSSFAQAFPGTMPYSEGIGFIADIKEEDDIDMVYYVVAHEMAHQWWAHQVIGANMLGATLLSETLAQYSALMVMEKEYGRDIMRKFLKYEMNSYLSSRGRELNEEKPLREVGAQQGYVHYRKGSVVMYYLKEMIGEDKVNAALKKIVDKFAYQDPPYPTSVDLIDALEEQTPEEYKYLLEDLFNRIVLFENRTLNTEYRKLDSGKFEVTIEVECRKFQSDEKGKQEEVEINDWIEIGAFAKPEEGRQYGATLFRERKKVTEPISTFTFVVDEEPDLAGIDPFSLLIDRLPDDNMKTPELVTE